MPQIFLSALEIYIFSCE